MIEIINGQIYDTDKAKAIHRRVHGKPGDNDYYSITLYYNYSTDEYFFYDEGGPDSPFAQQDSNSVWCSAAEIDVLDEEDARTYMSIKAILYPPMRTIQE